MTRSSLFLVAAALALPSLVLVPWALFGDAVPRALVATFGPRALAKLTLLLGGVSLTLLAVGGTRLVREARAADDPRRALRRLSLMGLGAVLVGTTLAGGVFAYYAHHWELASGRCRPALSA